MNDLWEIVLKIGLSALLGGAVGAEREREGKWAGLRTHMLIAVGAALIADVSISVGTDYGPAQGWDPGRIAAQIVSGLGFIGAGSIIQSRGAVRGLTTAAGLWVAGAIGLAVGVGYWAEATVTAVTMLVILSLLRPISRRLSGARQAVVVHLERADRLSDLLAIVERIGVEDGDLELSEEGREHGRRSVAVRFRGTPAQRRRFVELAREKGYALPED